MIFFTGDTHGNNRDDISRKFSSSVFPIGKTLTKNDYVIIAGDFGLVFNNDPDNKEELYWRHWLNDKPWTTLFVDGNHENFNRLYSNEFESIEMFGSFVTKINSSIFHLKRGHIYNIDNKKVLTIGGASSIDKYSRTPDVSWWKQEDITFNEMEIAWNNLSLHNNCVDYVISHTFPSDLKHSIDVAVKCDIYQPCFTSRFLNVVFNSISFKKWYFGHLHLDHTFPCRETSALFALYEAVIDEHDCNHCIVKR